MPKFHCPTCNQHIDADDRFSGMAANCPNCQSELIVPGCQVLDQATSSATIYTKKSKNGPAWRRCVKHSLISFGILFFGALIGPAVTARLGDRIYFPISEAFTVSLAVLVILAIISTGIASIIAAIANLALKKPFSRWIGCSYSITMIALSCLVFIADTIGINKHGRDQNKVVRLIWPGQSQYGLRVNMNLFRINLSLPERPKISRVLAPIEIRDNLQKGYYDQAMIKKDGYEVVVARFERKNSPVDLEEVRDGVISDLSDSPVFSNVEYSTEEISVTGRRALLLGLADAFATLFLSVI